MDDTASIIIEYVIGIKEALLPLPFYDERDKCMKYIYHAYMDYKHRNKVEQDLQPQDYGDLMALCRWEQKVINGQYTRWIPYDNDKVNELVKVMKEKRIEFNNGALCAYCHCHEYGDGKGDMLIYVKTIEGKPIELMVDNIACVWQIKKMVEDKISVPVDQQMIIWAGKQLEDHRTLQAYSVCRKCVLHLVIRRRNDGQPSNEINNAKHD